MPAATSVVINDGSADRTYAPQTIRSDGAVFLDRSSGQPNLFAAMTLSNRVNANNVSKGELTLNVVKGTTNSDTGITSPDGKGIAEVKFSFPPNYTTAERTELINLLVDALGNSTVLGTLRDLESVY